MRFKCFYPLRRPAFTDSKAQAEQMRALAFERFTPNPEGSLPERYMQALGEALKLHLVL